jgi:hypothetical protein
MTLFCFASMLFMGAFAVHWLWWRMRIPRRQTATLLGIFFGLLVLGLCLVRTIPALEPSAPHGIWQLLHVMLFHTAFSLAYVIAYSALEERSPSMTVLVAVADSEPDGLSAADLSSLLLRMSPLDSRLEAMIRDRMIEFDGASYRLTSKGSAWALVLGGWRRLLALPKGG